ncbi:MAG: hypothetical protein U0163_21115 [Gemmatimonadaceae bacterium]
MLISTNAEALIVYEGHPIERDVLHQEPNVFERIDRHADLVDFWARDGVVGVEAEQRGQVEVGGESRFAVCEEVFVPAAGVRPSPNPATRRIVHGRARYIVAWTPRVNGYSPGNPIASGCAT